MARRVACGSVSGSQDAAAPSGAGREVLTRLRACRKVPTGCAVERDEQLIAAWQTWDAAAAYRGLLR